MENTGRRNIKVIIGANAGDEGKGNVTNLFCMTEEPVLGILTNGGPQRGHTAWKDGKSHVFGHFCAGTLNGALTWFAPGYMINPMQFMREYGQLEAMGVRPRAYIDPDCRFTTPWDMMLNQAAHAREGSHHTCGMGIWETYQRYALTEDAVRIGQYLQMTETEQWAYLNRIRDRALQRMREEMDPAAAARWIPVAADENLCRRYMEDLQAMCTEKASMKGRGILTEYGNLIFENGQGLLLDWSDDEEEAVYTTPSRTGLHDAAALIEDCFEGETAEACYVTRTYLTRHGDGPLRTECCKEELDARVRETTNVTNSFQGHFRFGRLDTEAMEARIRADFAGAGSRNNWKASIAVTHTDQCDPGEELLEMTERFDERYLIGGVGRTQIRS